MNDKIVSWTYNVCRQDVDQSKLYKIVHLVVDG